LGRIDLDQKPSTVRVLINTSGAVGLDENSGAFDTLRGAFTATDQADVLTDRSAGFTVIASTGATFIALAQDVGARLPMTTSAG